MIAWAAENMLWASAATLLVLAIRVPVARLLGAGAAYGLWLVPALRLVAPPMDWFAPFASPLPPLVFEIGGAGGGAPLPPDGGPGQWAPLILAVWAGGAVLFLLHQAIAYRIFLSRLRLPADSVARFRGLPVLVNPAVDGPIAIGLFQRRIVVPADFHSRYSEEEQGLALAHEAHHHRRLDILANHVALVMLALNWFNPIAWLSFRAFRMDQELSCDAAVAGSTGLEARSHYGRALVKSASRPGLIAACPLNHANQLKRRLKMLNHHKQDRRRLWAGSAFTAVLIGASLLFGTAGQAQERRSEPDRVIIMEMKEGSAPAAGERREFRIRRGEDGRITTEGLPPEAAERFAECHAQNEAINIDTGDGRERNRILVCTKDGASPANRLQVLQQVRERMARSPDLNEETKQRMLAEIDRAIAAARGN